MKKEWIPAKYANKVTIVTTFEQFITAIEEFQQRFSNGWNIAYLKGPKKLLPQSEIIVLQAKMKYGDITRQHNHYLVVDDYSNPLVEEMFEENSTSKLPFFEEDVLEEDNSDDN